MEKGFNSVTPDTAASPPSVKRSWLALGLVALVLIVFWPLVQHPTDLLVGPQNAGRNDLTSSFLAMRMFARSAVADGQRPVWYPWILLGQPWIGNPQSAAWYPPNWIAIAIGHPAALGWLMVLHQLWAGLGTYFFARRMGCRSCSALFGGAVMLAAPYYIAQIGEGHLNQVCLAAWIPWAFWAFEKWRAHEPSARWLLPGVLTLAVFCGHVQEAFYVVLLLSLHCLDEIVGAMATGRGGHGLRHGWRWMGVGLAVAGLTAVEVWPIYTQMGQVIRGKAFSVAEASQISAGWDHMWQLLNPFALGGPADYHGTGKFYWETLCHFGLIALLFAAWGVIGGFRRAGLIRWTLVLAFAVLFAMGPWTPIYVVCHKWVPGVAMFRAPSRMLFMASALVAMLAAIGADQLLTTVSKRGTRWVFGLLCATATTAALTVYIVGRPENAADLWQRVLLQPHIWAWLAGGCVAALLMTATRPRVAMLGTTAAVALATAELSFCAHSLLRTIPSEHLRRDSELAAKMSQASRWERVLSRHEHFTDDESCRHQLCKLPGYEPAPLVRTVDIFDALTGGRQTPEQVLGFQSVDAASWNKELLDLLGVRWMVTDDDQGELAGWTKVAAGTVPAPVTIRGAEPAAVPYVLYRNESPFPRAFVVGNALPLGRNESLRRRIEGWDPSHAVLLENDVLPAGPRAEFQAAELIEYGADRVVIDVEIKAPGYLVLTDAWTPGWRAEDGSGNSLEVLRANHGLRAVPLPQGKHRVTMTFHPPLWTLSALASLCTSLLMAVALRSRQGPLPAPAASSE
jgi:hypothetical protein